MANKKKKKHRNPIALAMILSRKSEVFKDRRSPRGGSCNKKREIFLEQEL